MKRVFGGACLLLGAILCIGCQRDPAVREAKFLEQGQNFMTAKDYSRAALAFNNAAQVNPRRAETWYQLALANLNSGKGGEGVAALRRALEVDPAHTGAQLRLSELMLQSRDPSMLEDALKRLEQVAAANTNEPEALDLLALAELKLRKPEDAVKHLQEALKRFPGRLRSSAALAAVQYSKGDFEAAEATLKAAVAQAPQSADAALALGQFYIIAKQPVSAERELKRAIQLDASVGPAWMALAGIQAAQGRMTEAEESYKAAAALPKANLSYVHAAFLLQQGKYDAAIAELEGLSRSAPNDRDARLRLLGAYVMSGRQDQATALLAEVLKKNPKDTDALMLRSRVSLVSGRMADAEADIQQVLKLHPDSADAHYALAQIYARMGRERMRIRELSEAQRLRPDALAVRVELARAHISGGRPQIALQVIDETPAAQKADVRTIEARNWALAALNRVDEAIAVLEHTPRTETEPALRLQRGVFRTIKKDFAGARKDAEAVLSGNPDHAGAINLLIQASAAQGDTATALMVVRRMAALQPKSPPRLILAGEWYARLKKPEEARQSFQAAKAAAPAYSAPDLALAALEANEGKADAAKSTLKAVIAKEPQNQTANLMLAQLEYTSNDRAAALSHYRAVADLNPDHTDAQNATAYLLAATDPDEAMRYAQRAVELDPQSAQIQDTVGWVHYRKGNYAQAVSFLETAVNRERNPVREFHLAMSYIKMGDTGRGNALLNQVLAKRPDLLKTEKGW